MKLISVKMKKSTKIIISVVAIVLAVVAGAFAFINATVKPPEIVKNPVITDVGDGTDTESDSSNVTPPDGIKTGDTYSFLLAGYDNAAVLTDVMMVVSFNTKDYTINVLNIPRDTMIADEDFWYKKFNGAYYSQSGEKDSDNMIEKVEEMVGFSIDNYMVIDLDVFIEAVDLIGGVEIDVPMRMKYTDTTYGQELFIDLQPGLQTLDGEQAMGFIRFRKGDAGYPSYASADLGRIETQRLFIEAVTKKLLSPDILLKIPDLISTLISNVDTDFEIGELIWLANEALKVDMENDLGMFTVPGYADWAYNLSYYFVYEDDLLEMLNENFNPTDKDITDANINVQTHVPYGANPPKTVEVEETEPEDDVKENTDTSFEGTVEEGTAEPSDPEATESTEETNDKEPEVSENPEAPVVEGETETTEQPEEIPETNPEEIEPTETEVEETKAPEEEVQPEETEPSFPDEPAFEASQDPEA